MNKIILTYSLGSHVNLRISSRLLQGREVASLLKPLLHAP